MTDLQASTIPDDIRARVIAVANELSKQLPVGKSPTVDQVRREAKIDMNTATLVMREWRKSKNTALPVVIAIPETIQQAATSAIGVIWTQAQALASDNLRNAQAAWDGERLEFDSLRMELSEVVDDQAAELEKMKSQLSGAAETIERQQQELLKASKVEADNIELAKQLAELKKERDKAHKDAQEAREKAARLEGALSSTEAQNKAILDAIGRTGKSVK